jgi:RimJ/RimL family protein N-acetyltransferase
VFAHRLDANAELRALEPWQAEELAAHVDAVRAHLAPWIPFASRVVDIDTARALLRRFADEQARDAGRLYGIWVDGELAGGTLFKTFDAAAGVCEIGVWLAPHAEGRGLVTRAVRHMIDWAVVVRGISRVEWHTDPDNTRSKAVARRLGMRLDGVLRSAFVVGGVRHDTEVWSLLAPEWLAARDLDPVPTPALGPP